MSRVKRSVHARKKRRETLARAKGYRGQASKSYKRAKEALLMRLAEDVAELGTIEQRPQQDGRNMTMLLAPLKRKPQAEPQPAPAG